MDAKLLDILRCPQNRTRLHLAEPELLARINRSIEANTAVNLAGERLRKRLDGGLIREAGDLLYPVIDHIPVMLPDEAIDLAPYQ
ncbi:MAG: Trm112 family protein [Pirellulales bacterium]|nr:Trm112 family protein [Pirellulales bacterium]